MFSDRKVSLEEKLVYLISEYKTLLRKQVLLYLSIDDGVLDRIIKSLSKKGRLFYDEEKGIIKSDKNMVPDEKIIKCFWVALDFKDMLNFHCIAGYPMVIAIYVINDVYEVYYCPRGEEYSVSNAITRLQQNKNVKTIIVVEKEEQMPLITVPNAFLCTVSEEGEVKYFE